MPSVPGPGLAARIAALSDAERDELLGLLCRSVPGVVAEHLVLLDDDAAPAGPEPGPPGPLGPQLPRRGRHRNRPPG